MVWSKPPHPVPGQPIPIPPRNEPHLSVIGSIAGPLVSSESGHPSAPSAALSYQATLRADIVCSEPLCPASQASKAGQFTNSTVQAVSVGGTANHAYGGKLGKSENEAQLEGECLKVKEF